MMECIAGAGRTDWRDARATAAIRQLQRRTRLHSTAALDPPPIAAKFWARGIRTTSIPMR
jgi:hypothetical protein